MQSFLVFVEFGMRVEFSSKMISALATRTGMHASAECVGKGISRIRIGALIDLESAVFGLESKGIPRILEWFSTGISDQMNKIER
jgi:hypothetical protein